MSTTRTTDDHLPQVYVTDEMLEKAAKDFLDAVADYVSETLYDPPPPPPEPLADDGEAADAEAEVADAPVGQAPGVPAPVWPKYQRYLDTRIHFQLFFGWRERVRP